MLPNDDHGYGDPPTGMAPRLLVTVQHILCL